MKRALTCTTLLMMAGLSQPGVELLAQAADGPTIRSALKRTAPAEMLLSAAKSKGIENPAPAIVSKACVLMTIECNTTVTGELTPDDCDLGDNTVIDFWEFQGAAGQMVTITQRSSQFDSFLFLIDPNLDAAATDDDGGGGLDSRIQFTLDQSGVWTIGANGFGPGDLGNYTLSLTCVGDVPTTPAAPSNLMATALSSTEVQLDWQDNSDNEDEFRVEVRQTGVGGFQDIGSVSADSIGAIVQGLAPATAFDFRVRARNADGNSPYSNVASATTFSDSSTCNPTDPTNLCLLDGRFRVEVDWRNAAGGTGQGMKVPFGSNDSGLFYFFDPDNWEMLVKMVDACNSPFNSFWLFSAATTDVEYTLRVTDTQTGAFKEYFNPLNNAAPAITDTQAFATCP